MSFWGPLVTEVDVDVAVVKTLRQWFPYYLTQAEVERSAELQLGDLARPKPDSYANTIEDDEFLDHTLPAIIVTTARADEPETDGNGIYNAGFVVRISAVVRGRTPPESRAVAALFGALVRRVLVQQASLLDFAAGTRWRGGTLAALEDVTGAGRYLCASINDFTVFVDEVVQAGVGPLVPPDEDPVYEPPDDSGEPWDPLTSVGDVNVAIVDKE
jgi:hypothetical protein